MCELLFILKLNVRPAVYFEIKGASFCLVNFFHGTETKVTSLPCLYKKTNTFELLCFYLIIQKTKSTTYNTLNINEFPVLPLFYLFPT